LSEQKWTFGRLCGLDHSTTSWPNTTYFRSFRLPEADELAERDEVAVLVEVERGHRLRFLPSQSDRLWWASFARS
jgi:hypothetical protein